jgi:Tol biopolymer transport system component
VIGQKLGPYQLLAKLGEGGMGEVYKGVDTRLGRPVAVKFLSSELADAAGRGRFQREAQLASSLNHPHILTVHDVGEFAGRHYLVTELVDGGTLQHWALAETRTWKQIVDLLVGIADGLAAAHTAGIMHRDIKPANILVGANGYAKLADFGLAKLADTSRTDAHDTVAAAPTQLGVIVGTVPYMSPEQAAGRPLDTRSDIFSFGVVLYELLAGHRPFEGKTDLEVMQTVIHAAPKPLPDTVPVALCTVVEKALEKDPAERYQSARDLVVDLRRAIRLKTEQRPAAILGRRPYRMREAIAWGAAVMFALGAAALYVTKAPADVASIAFEQRPPEGGEFTNTANPDQQIVAVSPEGQMIAFSATVQGRNGVWIRRLNDDVPRLLDGSDNGYSPFWSPDSRRVAFFADQQLKAIDVAGGPARVVSSVPATARTGTWSEAGDILFSDLSADGGIFHVASEGGVPKRVAAPDPARQEDILLWPEFLPDGHRFVYMAGEHDQTNTVWIGSLSGGERKLLMEENSRVVYAASGHVLFGREGSLMAQRFNVSELRLEGAPVQVIRQVQYFRPTGQVSFSVSRNGVLAYQPFGSSSRLAWFERNGRESGAVQPLAVYQGPRLSPDGKRIVMGKIDPRYGTTDVYITDLATLASTRLTFDFGDEFSPVWSPDGRSIAFAWDNHAPPFLHKILLDGTGVPESIVAPTGTVQMTNDWLRDGSILYQDISPSTTYDLWLLPRDAKPRKLLASRFNETLGALSPDGRWLAYVSDELGSDEVYVRSYPQLGTPRRISTNGGTWPRWAPNGRELYFLERGQLMAVTIRLSSEFEAGSPTLLLHPSPGIVDYDVAADGRFLVNIGRVGYHVAPIHVIVNWTAGLKP